MTALAALFPPPLLLQHRAWSEAYTLISEYQTRLTQGELERLAWVAARRPERLGWKAIGEALAMYRGKIGVRT